MEIKQADAVLCKFYFSDLKKSKNRSVLVLTPDASDAKISTFQGMEDAIERYIESIGGDLK